MKTLKHPHTYRKPAYWRVDSNLTWLQCHDPALVERVRKLRGAKLVAAGVNVYLRTYSIPHPAAWVESFLTKSENPPSNRPFFSARASRTSDQGQGIESTCPTTPVPYKSKEVVV